MKALQRNNVKVIGNGNKTILFAHGYGCDQNMWRFVYPAFTDDYKVILFDHVGFGGSDTSEYTPKIYGSLQAYADNILEICEALDLKDVIFVGHSVSAMIGILAANKMPKIFSKLILIGPSPRYINETGYVGGFDIESIHSLLESLDSDYLAWSNAMAPVIMGNAEKPELGEELAASFCRSNEEIAKNFAYLTFLSDGRPDLKKVKVKTLVLQCKEDIIAPLEVGQFVHQSIPNSNMVIMEATGHCPNLSAPVETIAAIKNFLQADTDIN